MSTKQGYIKDFENNKMIPETTSAMVTDLAKNQALSQTLLDTPDKDALGYEAFSTVTDYAVGDKVYYANKLYAFTAAHEAGAWTGEDVEEVNIKDFLDAINAELENKADKNGYYATLRSGLADNLVDERPFTEMGQLHMTASSVSAAENGITYPSKDIADGQSQVLQLMGNGAAFMQLYPCALTGISVPTRTARMTCP